VTGSPLIAEHPNLIGEALGDGGGSAAAAAAAYSPTLSSDAGRSWWAQVSRALTAPITLRGGEVGCPPEKSAEQHLEQQQQEALARTASRSTNPTAATDGDPLASYLADYIDSEAEQGLDLLLRQEQGLEAAAQQLTQALWAPVQQGGDEQQVVMQVVAGAAQALLRELAGGEVGNGRLDVGAQQVWADLLSNEVEEEEEEEEEAAGGFGQRRALLE